MGQRGRPPRPADQPAPRRSGPSGAHRKPDPAAAEAQRELMAQLAADLGAERCRRHLAGPGPVSLVELAEVLGVSAARVGQVARADRPTRAETLARWEREIRAWIAGEEMPELPAPLEQP